MERLDASMTSLDGRWLREEPIATGRFQEETAAEEKSKRQSGAGVRPAASHTSTMNKMSV
jgi:hypothetical protein